MTSLRTVLQRLLEVFELLKIPYLIGGSVASSVHGLPRATVDIDFVADFRAEMIPRFVVLLQKEFYVDAGMIEEALAHESSFNVIHFETGHKFDIFPLVHDPFRQTEMERRKVVESTLFGSDPLSFPVASAEDILLSKLAWYRLGGEVSERQWRDVRGIVQVRGEALDRAYLQKWAAYLKVADLLERALRAE